MLLCFGEGAHVHPNYNIPSQFYFGLDDRMVHGTIQPNHVRCEPGTRSMLRLKVDHSSIVYVLPMDKLQRAHIGTKLFRSVLPPRHSGTLCPQWKSWTVIVLLHHSMRHFISYTRPQLCSHTCSRRAAGILLFLAGLVLEGLRGCICVYLACASVMLPMPFIWVSMAPDTNVSPFVPIYGCIRRSKHMFPLHNPMHADVRRAVVQSNAHRRSVGYFN